MKARFFALVLALLATLNAPLPSIVSEQDYHVLLGLRPGTTELYLPTILKWVQYLCWGDVLLMSLLGEAIYAQSP